MRLLLILVLGFVLWFCWSLGRSGSELARLRAKLEAQGEGLTAEALGLDRNPIEDPTWPILVAAASAFETLGEARVEVSEGRDYESVRAKPPQVSWQQPFLYSSSGEVLDWRAAAEAVDRLRPETQRVYVALRDRAPAPGRDCRVLPEGVLPNYLPMRQTFQGLHQTLMVELHRGEMAAAYTNLVTLIRLGNYHHEAWSLVAQMLRVAAFGLAEEGLWQALQSTGWTPEQLEALQQELAQIDLVSPLSRVLEVERVGVLRSLASYREKGVKHLRAVYRQWGVSRPTVDGWRQRLYFHYWRLFRDRDVEVQILENMQRQIDRARLLAQGHPVDTLPPTTAQDRRSSVQVWLDDWGGSGKGVTPIVSYTQAPDFGNTLRVVALREAHRRLALTALALRRFQAIQGRLPQRLEELVPDYLRTVPRSPFDGRAVRYRPGSGVQFELAFRDGEGEVRQVLDEALQWPMAEPALPKPEPSRRATASLSREPLPLISFDEAPLLDAIKHLAREVGMNIIFDPRVSARLYPPVTLQLTNVSALHVLEALLEQYRLRLELDSRDSIYRITD